jgi:hypothetical protein
MAEIENEPACVDLELHDEAVESQKYTRMTKSQRNEFERHLEVHVNAVLADIESLREAIKLNDFAKVKADSDRVATYVYREIDLHHEIF